MAKRRFISQLPGIHQTNTLKNFFNATVDQVFQPGETQSVNAFVGRKPGYFNPQRDFYKVEIDDERRFYQLEAAMTTSNDDGTFNDLLFYQDVVNNLRFQGANTSDHSRLFNTDYYSWCPPVNISKLDAYREYFWMPDGPPIMILDIPKTKMISDGINNIYPFPITVSDSIYSLSVKVNDEFIVNGYILDGNIDDGTVIDGNILDNIYIDGNTMNGFSIQNKSIVFDTILTPNNTVQIWINSNFKQNIIDKTEYHYPLFASTYAVEQVIEQYVDVANPNVILSRLIPKEYPHKELPTPPYLCSDMRIRIDDNNGSNIFQVNFYNGKLTLTDVSELHDIIQRTPQYKTIERIASNTITSNDWSKSNHWYHKSVIMYSDISYHPTQAVRPILEYFNNIKLFNNGVDYTKNEPLFDIYDNNQISLSDVNKYPQNNFAGSKIFSYEVSTDAGIDSVLGINVVRNKFGLITFRDHLSTDIATYRDGTVGGYKYFKLTRNNVVTFQNNWRVSGTSSQIKNTNGLFDIPLNLHANPTNKEVDIISPNEWNAHFKSLLLGSDWTLTNDQFDLTAGTNIIQCRGSLLKTMLINSDTTFDYIKSTIYIEHEYTRYRNKFLQLLKQYEIQNQSLTVDNTVASILKQLKSAKTIDFPFYNNGVIGEYFIPATGAFLGMSPLWTPELVLENGRNGSIVLIRGHDGSLIPGFTRFTSKTIKMVNGVLYEENTTIPLKFDFKDTVILALENLIYNSVSSDLKSNRRPVFDLTTYISGKFRKADYTRIEYLNIARPIFERWAVKTALKYRTNTIYDATNPFTYNYSLCTDIDGFDLPGFWRGIYLHYFDTDRPHTHPWEMLGFTTKPVQKTHAWEWDDCYSWLATAGNNSKRQALISALTRGLVSNPSSTPVYDITFARANVIKYLPIDTTGKLLNPIEAGIVLDNGIVKYDSPWDFGDMGPVEYQWFTSYSRSFALSQLGYLTKPVHFVESNWETADEIEVNGYDWVSKKTGKRKQVTDYIIHNELVNGKPVRVLGLQMWLSDYLRSLGKDVTLNLGKRVRNLGVNLAHKLGGFIDSASLKAFTENSGLIPQEDVKVVTYKSPSIREEFYGGLIIQWTGRGWKVLGYDVVDPVFNILPIDIGGTKTKISIDGVIDTIATDWHPNTYYTSNVLIQNKGINYRCNKTHTSSRLFEDTFWTSEGLSHSANSSITYYKNHFSDIERVHYGTEFYSSQEVADFISGYSAYLVSRGWVFDEYDDSINDIRNWEFSTKEFLNWTQVKWTPNTFVALSPRASSISFNSTHGTIQNVEQMVNGTYSLLGKEGTAINKSKVSATRTDTGITVSVTDDAIYGLRLSINEVEQAIIFKNTTIFNDVIYQPLYAVRQNRIRIIALLSTLWSGKLDAPGFIVTNNRVLPSFEKQVEDIRYMYDIEKTINLPLRDNARHQIGYQSRPYLENLMYNEVNQFEFYQGMIQQKGAPGVFNKLLRNDELTQSQSLNFLEEWAFRTGVYGGTIIDDIFEMELANYDIKQEPQLVTFSKAASYWDLGDFDTEPDKMNPPQCFEIGIPKNVDVSLLQTIDPDDAVIELFSIDSSIDNRIIMPYTDVTPFSETDSYVRESNDLPNAGYARISESHWQALDLDNLNSVLTASPNNIEYGQRIWLYSNDVKQWGMHRADNTTNTTLNNTIMGIYPHDAGVRVVMLHDHNIKTGETIYINKLINAISTIGGVHTVIESGLSSPTLFESNEFIIDGSIVSEYEYITETQPEVLKLINMRLILTNVSDAPLVEMLYLTKDQVMNIKTPDGINSLLSETNSTFSHGELIYIDIGFNLYNQIDNNTKNWRVFIFNATWNNGQGRFEKYRTQPARLRSDLIRDVKIFDTKASRTSQKLNANPLLNSEIIVLDPIHGIISGVAEKEIWYKLESDPAYYNTGENATDIGLNWGNLEVGRLWWNMSTTKFLQYYTDDVMDDVKRISVLNDRLIVLTDNIAKLSGKPKGRIPSNFPGINSILTEMANIRAELPGRQTEIDLELKYRKDNWGSLAPNSTVDIYEWTRSLVSPDIWVTNRKTGITPEMYDGDVLNASSPSWVETSEWDDMLSQYQTVYYFWVKGRKNIPKVDFRSVAADQVAAIITNPEQANIAWVAPISNNSFIISGISTFLNSSSSIQFRVARTDSETPKHVEWALMREGDERSVPTYELWTKLIHSISGKNDRNESIPNLNRYITDRVGYDVEHGQSLFNDLSGARKHLTQYLNTLFASILLVDERRDISILNSADLENVELSWYQKVDSYYIAPTPQETVYDSVFTSYTEFDQYLGDNTNNTRFDTAGLVTSKTENNIFWTVVESVKPSNYDTSDFSQPWDIDDIRVCKLWDMEVINQAALLNLVGKIDKTIRIKVLGNIDNGNFASIWQLNSTGDNFSLVAYQRYNSRDLYDFVDWYGEGYTVSDEPLISFATQIDRDLQLGTDPYWTVVKVLNDGKGRWMWTSFVDNQWIVVAKESGTIKLKDTAWQNTGNMLVVGDTLPSDFKSQVLNRDMGYEIDYLLNALRENILTSTEMNKLFFSLINYVHTEQNSLDWCFKTSFMYVTGYTERLVQDPIAFVDRTSNLLQYINEVKPYHVKVRDFISKYGVTDAAKVKAMDFDFPAYYDKSLSKFRQLDPTISTDIGIIETGIWNNWYQQYQYANNNFARKIKLKLKYGYDQTSTLTQAIIQSGKDEALVKVSENTRIRVLRMGDYGSPTTTSQSTISTTGLNIELSAPIPLSNGVLVFSNGVRVDPSVVSFDPYTSKVTTPKINAIDNFEVASFGYSSTDQIKEILYFNKTDTVNTFYLGDSNSRITTDQLMVTVSGVQVVPSIINRMVVVPSTSINGLVQIAILNDIVDTTLTFAKTDIINTYDLGSDYKSIVIDQIIANTMPIYIDASIENGIVTVPKYISNGTVIRVVITSTYTNHKPLHFVREFTKTDTNINFDLSPYWHFADTVGIPNNLLSLMNVTINDLTVTIPEKFIKLSVSAGVITVPNEVSDGQIAITILKNSNGKFGTVVCNRFNQLEFKRKIPSSIVSSLVNSSDIDIMNNFVIEVDGLRKIASRTYQTNVNAITRVLRLGRDAPLTELTAQLNGTTMVVGSQLSKTYTINSSIRRIYIGNNPSLSDITVTDLQGNNLIVGRLMGPLTNINMASLPVRPVNASLILYEGNLIQVNANAGNMTIKVYMSEFIPTDFTNWNWLPANASFVKIKDAIVSTNANITGLLTVSDKVSGEFDITRPIDDAFTTSKILTVTDFTKAKNMDSKTWTFNTNDSGYYPIDVLPVSDSAIWVNLNGKRLINNIDYRIIKTDLPTWDNFTWAVDGMESDYYQLQGNVEPTFDGEPQVTYGLEFINAVDMNSLLVITVFKNKQVSIEQEFEIIVKKTPDIQFDMQAFESGDPWDNSEYGLVNHITLKDKYELEYDMNRVTTQVKVKQIVGPYTKPTITIDDFKSNIWIDNEEMTITKVINGVDPTLTCVRGAEITSITDHTTKTELKAPKFSLQLNSYVPL